jgi:hypothetical protein
MATNYAFLNLSVILRIYLWRLTLAVLKNGILVNKGGISDSS